MVVLNINIQRETVNTKFFIDSSRKDIKDDVSHLLEISKDDSK